MVVPLQRSGLQMFLSAAAFWFKSAFLKVVLRPKKNFVFPLDFKTMLTKH